MMFLFGGLVAGSVLVGLGYLALWTSGRNETPKNIGAFGRILAIALFCVAGLVILAGLLAAPMAVLRGLGPRGFLGRVGSPHGPEKTIRIERHIGSEEEFERQMDFDDDAFEEHVREVVEDMLEDEDGFEDFVGEMIEESFHDELFEERVIEVVGDMRTGR